MQSSDLQTPPFGRSAAAERPMWDRLLSATVCCALHPCAVVMRRCGWLPPADESSSADDDANADEWEPNMDDYEVLRLDEMEPMATSGAPAQPVVTTPTPPSSRTASPAPAHAAVSSAGTGSSRGYAPPRPRPDQLQDPSQLRDGLAHGVEAPSTSSLFDTEPSSTLSSAHHRSAGERWVMQRGALVRMGRDGVLAQETTSAMNSRTRPRTGFHASDGSDNAAESTTSRRSTAAAAAVIDELEQLRHPINRLAELTAVLERCCRYLPLRVEVASDHAAVAQTGDGALPFTLQLLGPLQAPPYSRPLCAEALTVIEDVLLDDCAEDNLRLSCLHICDVNLADRPESVGDGTAADASALGSNAFLDMLLSPTSGSSQYAGTSPSRRDMGRRGDSGDDQGGMTGRQADAVRASQRECESRLLVLIKNVLESRSRDLATLRFTRCTFSPLSVGELLMPCLPYARRLLFEQCPLSSVHIDALLQSAHVLTQRTSALHEPHVALGALMELQLCGALSLDVMQELLRFFADEVPFHDVPPLRILRLPFSLARAAREHPFAASHPTLKIEVSA